MTTSSSIFASAITGSEAYGVQLRDLSAHGAQVRMAPQALTTFGARWACDVLRRVYDSL